MRYPQESSNRDKPPEDRSGSDRDNRQNADNNYRNRPGSPDYRPGPLSDMVNPVLRNMNYDTFSEENQGLQSPYFTNPVLHDNDSGGDRNREHAAGYRNENEYRNQNPSGSDNSDTPDYQDRENYIRNRDRHTYGPNVHPGPRQGAMHNRNRWPTDQYTGRYSEQNLHGGASRPTPENKPWQYHNNWSQNRNHQSLAPRPGDERGYRYDHEEEARRRRYEQQGFRNRPDHDRNW